MSNCGRGIDNFCQAHSMQLGCF